MKKMQLAASALLAGCSSTAPALVPVEAIDHLDVVEAIVRHQVTNNASGGQQNVAAFCLRIRRDNPTGSLLKSLSDVSPEVRPADACEIREGGVVEKASGMPALEFHIDNLRCGGDLCEATGGYYEGNLSASGNLYKIERRNGSWVVTSDTMQWIS